jgi:hypothetical protein
MSQPALDNGMTVMLVDLLRRWFPDRSEGLGPGRERREIAQPSSGRERREIVPPGPALGEKIGLNNHLASHAKVVTSQDGEDGVIDAIMQRLGIRQGWCVEFGAWDGKAHSNTWNLVHNHRWKAVYVEPNGQAFDQLVANSEGFQDIYCFNEFVGIEGDQALDSILARTPIPLDFDLLVIDIDSNDYFVWEACKRYRPKVVMIEINPFIPPNIHFVKWNEGIVKASASLLAVYDLGKRKGYELICVIGGNAVFVRVQDFALFDVPNNHPTAMFKAWLETRLFQGYDGSLFLAGNRKLIWRHQIDRTGKLEHVEVTDDDIQVLPQGLRVFRPRLSYENPFLEEHAGRLDRTRVPSNRLLLFQQNVTSECGEDGVLRHIFDRLGLSCGYCVEVGAHDGKRFSNTWALINQQGWHALLIEKDEEAFRNMQVNYASSPRVKTVHAEVVTAGEHALETVMSRAGVPPELDFLCIDVEGNDYHLWSSVRDFAPKVVMVDFNPTVSNDVIFVQENSLTANHGSSLRAFIELAASKGYELAAVTSWNAIFVRHDLFSCLDIQENDIDRMYYPIFEMSVIQSIDSYLTVVGCDRLIRHNYVFDPEQMQPLPPNVRALPFTTGKLGELRSTFFCE